MNYDELKIIATCNSYLNGTSCKSSYLDTVTNKWGLATTTGHTSSSVQVGTLSHYVSKYQFKTLSYQNKVLYDLNGKSIYKSDLFNNNVIDSTSTTNGDTARLRPVIVIKSTAKITGGNGTSNNPYTIG